MLFSKKLRSICLWFFLARIFSRAITVNTHLCTQIEACFVALFKVAPSSSTGCSVSHYVALGPWDLRIERARTVISTFPSFIMLLQVITSIIFPFSFVCFGCMCRVGVGVLQLWRVQCLGNERKCNGFEKAIVTGLTVKDELFLMWSYHTVPKVCLNWNWTPSKHAFRTCKWVLSRLRISQK